VKFVSTGEMVGMEVMAGMVELVQSPFSFYSLLQMKSGPDQGTVSLVWCK